MPPELTGCSTWNIIAMAVIMVWEWWLGRTDKVRAGSTVTLLWHMAIGTILAVLLFIQLRREKWTSNKPKN